ncbi:MAG: hypothetical protein ACE5LU_20685, partial [Anaerolineae bacterium]
MNARPTRVITWLTRLTGLLVLTLAMAVTLARAQVIPTNEWVNFFSANSTVLGQPVPAGARIAAFDPSNTQCAEFTVLVAGAYGVMPCYRDDANTPGDEGAEPGDVISFTIDGLPATPIPVSLNANPVPPSTNVTWTQFGDLWEVDLQVVASPTPSPTVTPSPTATATSSPTATATGSPTPTSTSSPTATATGSPTAT